MPRIHAITPCLWFDTEAEAAANFYVSVFPRSGIRRIARYPDAAKEVGHVPGAVMVVDFELSGHRFTALNAGPECGFTPAVSFQVHCRDQREIDRCWEALSEDGDPSAQQCGWLSDKFGLSWQIVPDDIDAFYADDDPARAQRVMKAMLSMKKLDLAALRRAAAG